MPLTPDEVAKIQETETLREDFRKTLHPDEPPPKNSAFTQQIILLVLGFVLTGLVGGALTSYWKSKESENQRAYLVARQALDKQYTIINKTAQEVATTVAAVDDVLITYYDNGWTDKEVAEHRENWNKTSRNWRINAQLLSVEIDSAFANADINALFRDLVQKRTVLGNLITNLPRGKKEIEADKTLKQELEAANKSKQEVVEALQKCSAAMTAVVRQGSAP